jgi:hypothetical protein
LTPTFNSVEKLPLLPGRLGMEVKARADVCPITQGDLQRPNSHLGTLTLLASQLAMRPGRFASQAVVAGQPSTSDWVDLIKANEYSKMRHADIC